MSIWNYFFSRKKEEESPPLATVTDIMRLMKAGRDKAKEQDIIAMFNLPQDEGMEMLVQFTAHLGAYQSAAWSVGFLSCVMQRYRTIIVGDLMKVMASLMGILHAEYADPNSERTFGYKPDISTPEQQRLCDAYLKGYLGYVQQKFEEGVARATQEKQTQQKTPSQQEETPSRGPKTAPTGNAGDTEPVA